jgi:hypothetical protein
MTSTEIITNEMNIHSLIYTYIRWKKNTVRPNTIPTRVIPKRTNNNRLARLTAEFWWERVEEYNDWLSYKRSISILAWKSAPTQINRYIENVYND